MIIHVFILLQILISCLQHTSHCARCVTWVLAGSQMGFAHALMGQKAPPLALVTGQVPFPFWNLCAK